MDQARREPRVHRPHREEPVDDRAEALAQPVAVREPRHADRHQGRLRIGLGHEASDRVPQRRLQRRASPATALDPFEVVVAFAENFAQKRLDLGLRLPGQQAAVDHDLAGRRDHVALLGGGDHRRRKRQREQRLQRLRCVRIELPGQR